MSNIKEDIQRQTKNTINYYKDLEKIEEIPIDILRAMYKDVLAQQKQDKARIKELEEEKKVMCEEYCPKTVTCRNSIPKQKVKDEIETLRKMLKATMEGKLQKYTPNEIIIKTNTLEELLEDK